MALISLTTDMGLQDHYDAVVKAVILRRCPEARILDISHSLRPFDIARASFVLRNAYPEFPEKSIHIIGVLPELREGRPHLVAFHQGQYFIGADNGIFSLLFDEKPERLIAVDPELSAKDPSFPTKGVFTELACRLLEGEEPEAFGKPAEGMMEKALYRPVIDGNKLRGTFIYFDSYGNAISNITRDLFDEVGQGRDLTLRFRGHAEPIHRISENYDQVGRGEVLALFGSSGHLEIAINEGASFVGEGAQKLFGLTYDDSIQIEFHDR